MKARYSLLSQDEFDMDDVGDETGSLLGGISDMWPGDSGSGIKKTSASHDRPERSVTLRLYTMAKHHFMLAFSIFFLLFFISVMLGVMSPSMVHTTDIKASQVHLFIHFLDAIASLYLDM